MISTEHAMELIQREMGSVGAELIATHELEHDVRVVISKNVMYPTKRWMMTSVRLNVFVGDSMKSGMIVDTVHENVDDVRAEGGLA